MCKRRTQWKRVQVKWLGALWVAQTGHRAACNLRCLANDAEDVWLLCCNASRGCGVLGRGGADANRNGRLIARLHTPRTTLVSANTVSNIETKWAYSPVLLLMQNSHSKCARIHIYIYILRRYFCYEFSIAIPVLICVHFRVRTRAIRLNRARNVCRPIWKLITWTNNRDKERATNRERESV